MLHGQRVIVVLPAYRAGKTLERTYNEIRRDVVDDVILVDDGSDDDTLEVAARLGIHSIRHELNLGYGANQKTCYRAALDRGADIVVMLHPDYQYDPRLIGAMAGMIASGVYDLVVGSRLLCGGALAGGMPYYKYVANRVLTIAQNLALGAALSEYHSGYRAYSRRTLLDLPLLRNSNDFLFDNQVMVQAILQRKRIGEISCPAKYFPEASSINLRRSIVYGLGVLATTLGGLLTRLGWRRAQLLSADPSARLPDVKIA